MNNETCSKIRLLLVDYSDGVLPADQSRQIAGHLAQCAACREEIRLLEHSLALALEVWNETVSAADNSATTSLKRPRPIHSTVRRQIAWIGGAMAVSAVVILLLFGQVILLRSKPSGVTAQPIAMAKNNSTENLSAQPKEEIDVLEYIAREERSARLATSLQFLAAQPGLKQYKEDAERYLKDNYAGTTAVRMLEKQQTVPH
jgi:hypothetical protein